MIYVELDLYESHGTVRVRFYRDRYTYVEYSTCNMGLTSHIYERIQAPNELERFVRSNFDMHLEFTSDEPVTEFPGMQGTFHVKFRFDGAVTVDDARIITQGRGGTDLTKAFDNTFRYKILENLFNLVSVRDVRKINGVIDQLIALTKIGKV